MVKDNQIITEIINDFDKYLRGYLNKYFKNEGEKISEIIWCVMCLALEQGINEYIKRYNKKYDHK